MAVRPREFCTSKNLWGLGGVFSTTKALAVEVNAGTGVNADIGVNAGIGANAGTAGDGVKIAVNDGAETEAVVVAEADDVSRPSSEVIDNPWLSVDWVSAASPSAVPDNPKNANNITPVMANFTRALPKTFTRKHEGCTHPLCGAEKYLTRLWPEVCLEKIGPEPQFPRIRALPARTRVDALAAIFQGPRAGDEDPTGD